MERKKKYALYAGAWLVLVLVVLYILQSGVIGVPAGRLEQEARQGQRIAEDWQVVSAVGADIAGVLFYDEERQGSTFSVYVNRPGFSFGYFFRYGGSSSGVDQGVAGFSCERGAVVLSLNEPRVARIELNGGDTAVAIDPDQPFAYVMPRDAWQIDFYDENGQSVPIQQIVF